MWNIARQSNVEITGYEEYALSSRFRPLGNKVSMHVFDIYRQAQRKRQTYCGYSGMVQLYSMFSDPLHENLTLLYLSYKLQKSPGKEQLDTLLGFMLYIRRPCFPLSVCKRKWKLWASLKSRKCRICQVCSLNTWTESTVWGHYKTKTDCLL